MSIAMSTQAEHAVQWARDKAAYDRVSTNSGHLLLALVDLNIVPVASFGGNFDYTSLRLEINQGLALCRWGRQDLGIDAPSFKKSLSLAMDDAVTTKSQLITPAHLLLAVALEPTGPAGWVLAKWLRRDHTEIRRAVRSERYQYRAVAA